MRHLRHHQQRAFTLIELLIVIALLLIIMLMISFMFQKTRILYDVAAERGEVFTQGRLAIDQIEADLQGILPGNASISGAVSKDLLLYSQSPKDWTDIDSYIKPYQSDSGISNPKPIFQDTKYNINVAKDDAKSQFTEFTEIQPVIAFMSNTQWWDTEKREYQSGLAQVVYYLKRRKPYQLLARNQEFTPSSAYLMRLIIPQGGQTRIDPNPSKPPEPVAVAREEDICGSVLSLRVWAINHAAAAANAGAGTNQSEKMPIFTLLNDIKSAADGSFKDRMRKGGETVTNTAGADATQVSATPKLTFAFGSTAGSNAANEDRVFTVGQYPVAIMIELTVVDDGFDISDKGSFDGTIRTFKKVISMPAVEPTTALPESQVDLLKQAE